MASVIVIGLLVTLGVLLTIALLMVIGYFWWRYKRSQLEFVEPYDEEELSNGSMRLQQLQQQQQQQQQQTQCQTSVDTAQTETPQPSARSSTQLLLNQPSTSSQAEDPPKPAQPAQSNHMRKLNGFLNFKAPLIGAVANSQTKSPGGSSGGVESDRGGGNSKDNRSVSMVDMYIDQSEPVENVGQIHFSLEYDFQNTTLILKIIQGKELPAKDLSGTSDPYVRVTLLPDKKNRLETKIKRRTLNPRWNETFYFEGFPMHKLQTRVLHLHVFDYDRFSRDDSIGEVFLPLCQIDLSGKPAFWKALKPPAKDKCGDLLVSLCYLPSTSVLTLTIIKARNLKAKDINGKSDPYCKVWLTFGDKRAEKRKTPIYKCNLNPRFDAPFAYTIPWEKIRECSLDIMVMDFDNIGRNELIGRIILANKSGSGPSETKHWQDMIAKPRQTIVQWHRLKPE